MITERNTVVMTFGTPLNHARRPYRGPDFEHARVRDAMHVGVVECSPDSSLVEVARMMTTHRIHSVVVRGGGDHWDVISDVDVARAAGPDAAEQTAASLARTEVVTVGADQSVEHAAHLMADHGVSHLLVLQSRTGQPMGVISALDVADVVTSGSTI